jgi:hypothetical protein
MYYRRKLSHVCVYTEELDSRALLCVEAEKVGNTFIRKIVITHKRLT